QLEAEVHQDLRRHAFLFAQQAQQEVFGADVVVVEVASLLDGVLDDFLGARRLGQLAHRHHVRPGLDDLLDLEADLAEVDVQASQDVGGDARAFLDQSEEDVLGADVLVVEALRLLVGELHHLASPIRKAFIHSSRLRQSPSTPGWSSDAVRRGSWEKPWGGLKSYLRSSWPFRPWMSRGSPRGSWKPSPGEPRFRASPRSGGACPSQSGGESGGIEGVDFRNPFRL